MWKKLNVRGKGFKGPRVQRFMYLPTMSRDIIIIITIHNVVKTEKTRWTSIGFTKFHCNNQKQWLWWSRMSEWWDLSQSSVQKLDCPDLSCWGNGNVLGVQCIGRLSGNCLWAFTANTIPKQRKCQQFDIKIKIFVRCGPVNPSNNKKIWSNLSTLDWFYTIFVWLINHCMHVIYIYIGVNRCLFCGPHYITHTPLTIHCWQTMTPMYLGGDMCAVWMMIMLICLHADAPVRTESSTEAEMEEHIQNGDTNSKFMHCINWRIVLIHYSETSEERTLWGRAICPLYRGCPLLGGLCLNLF